MNENRPIDIIIFFVLNEIFILFAINTLKMFDNNTTEKKKV